MIENENDTQSFWKTSDNNFTLTENYLYGFRNWSEHPILDSLPLEQKIQMKAQILAAQQIMFQEFTSILKKQKNEADATIQMRISLAKFAHSLHLGKLFDVYYDQALSVDPWGNLPDAAKPGLTSLKI